MWFLIIGLILLVLVLIFTSRDTETAVSRDFSASPLAEVRKIVKGRPVVSVATVSPDGKPTSRVMYLERITEEGLIFATDSRGTAGQHLATNPNVALNFYEEGLHLQVNGEAYRLAEKISDEEFSKLTRGEQLQIVASEQSAEISSPHEYRQKFEAVMKAYQGKKIPRPATWDSYLVLPSTIKITNERTLPRTTVEFEHDGTKWTKKYKQS